LDATHQFSDLLFLGTEGVSSDFSRQKIRNTFIDTTGLGNIAENFDDRYNTAYVDLDNGAFLNLARGRKMIYLRAHHMTNLDFNGFCFAGEKQKYERLLQATYRKCRTIQSGGSPDSTPVSVILLCSTLSAAFSCLVSVIQGKG
jgi:hypothetical protein